MTQLYRLHYAPDNASLVIRLVLEELGVPYETLLLDRKTRAHKAPAYLAVNPNGLIPALETPDGPIFETAAILLWLADRHGKLAPAPESANRGAFLKWLFFASNGLHVSLRARFYPEQYVGQDATAHAALRAHLRGEVLRQTGLLEAEAAERPDWLGGPAPSVLDFYLACLFRWAQIYPADEAERWFQLENWPHLHAMASRLERCESTRAAIDAEGLGEHPFTAPEHPNPPEGSAT
ncbi:MAG: glutathione S-transferase family protein [Roseovarius sp.]